MERRKVSIGTCARAFSAIFVSATTTKDRRERSVALDEFTLSVLRAQVEMLEERAKAVGVEL